MKKILLLLSFFFSIYSFSQSLSTERVTKIKSSVVRLNVEDGSSEGTGFFINDKGYILTCWHVISPAIYKKGDTIKIKNITGLLSTGRKVKFLIPDLFFNQLFKSAVSYDYCLLVPDTSLQINTFLKIGSFDNVKEGEEVYSCGFPLGMIQPFISKGILSSKYIDSSLIFTDNKGVKTKIFRNVAIMDLTLNSGNSGGPIVKIGTTLQDDEVVGIADFNINPFGQAAEKIYTQMHDNNIGKNGVIVEIKAAGVSQTQATELFAAAISNLSNGISGCISINHLMTDLKKWNR